MKDTVQPKLTVHLPKVNLRLEDVSYLRSLSGDQKVHCKVSSNREDRLRILGLIEDTLIPATPQAVAQADKEIEDVKNKLRQFLETDDWTFIKNDLIYLLTTARHRKEPSKGITITDLGRQLLSQGEVMVKMKKTGCI